MILGIGTDIVEVARIKIVISRYAQRFLNRIFTSHEQEYCFKYKEPARHFAARFALKEAVAKALGTGFCKYLSWSDIEIRNDEQGKPTVIFSPNAAHFFNLSQSVFFVSISHCRDYATAFAIWTNNQQGEISLQNPNLVASTT